MPKAKVKDILTYATENKFGVAAINTLNIETVKYGRKSIYSCWSTSGSFCNI